MMNFKYINQSFRLLQENKFLSIISILGTSLSIAMIMVVVILFRAKTADTVPEVNRSRSLYVKLAVTKKKGSDGRCWFLWRAFCFRYEGSFLSIDYC